MRKEKGCGGFNSWCQTVAFSLSTYSVTDAGNADDACARVVHCLLGSYIKILNASHLYGMSKAAAVMLVPSSPEEMNFAGCTRYCEGSASIRKSPSFHPHQYEVP